GGEHEGGGPEGRRREAGTHEVDQPAQRRDQPRRLPRGEPLAARQPVPDHRELHGTEEEERAGPRREGEVGEGERRRVDDERSRRSPAPPWPTTACPDDEPEGEGA